MKWAIAISILFAVSVMMAFSEDEEERRWKPSRWLNCTTDCPADKTRQCLKCCMFKQKFLMRNATTPEDYDKVIDQTCECMHSVIKKQH